jgi:hypothetical protein
MATVTAKQGGVDGTSTTTPAVPAVPVDPSTVSGDYAAMDGYWTMVQDILDGADAMRNAGEKYLPRFPNESPADYKYRSNNAKFTNVYADIANSLCSKPFAEKTALEDKSASPKIEALSEDIDGQGNNLHIFASNLFFAGVNDAISWVLVDFTKAAQPADGRPLTQNEEAQQGLRPYWVHVPAKRLLSIYTAKINGKQEPVHARIEENYCERENYIERLVKQVRIFNRDPIYALGPDGETTDIIIGYEPATFELWRSNLKTWERIDNGTITLGIIPLVPFITGRRKGGTWQFIPPLKDAAFLQVEHYQQETNLKSIKELTAFPMVAGNGVTPPLGADGSPKPVPIGPRAVLYAPPSGDTGQHGEWKFIEPTAESLKFLAEDVKATEDQLRELGRQPLTATAGITVVVASLASQKASSAVQAWAFALKDALEECYRITALWLNDATKPVVRVFTDFALDQGDALGPPTLIQMRTAKDISQRTLWSEMQRRNVLSADFDPDAEEKALTDEIDSQMQQDDQAAARAAALGIAAKIDPNAPPAVQKPALPPQGA